SWLTRTGAIGGGSTASFRWQRIFLMTSPCVIGCGSVHAAALPTNGTGMPQRIFIRKGFALRRRNRAKGCLPVSEVAVRPGNGLSPPEFRIPQGSARGSTSKVHLRHQIVGKLIVYLNAAALRVRHQETAVHRVKHHGGGLGEGPLWLRTMDLTAALEIVR